MAVNRTDEVIAAKVDEAIEKIREARIAISDATIEIENDHRGVPHHGHACRELGQVQAHLQLSVIQLDEIGDDYRD